MELHSVVELSKTELLQGAPVSSRQTLVVLPSAPKKKNKFVIGDDSGSIQCVGIKKGVIEHVYRQATPEGRVECLTLGGAAGARDKVSRAVQRPHRRLA
jgi:hypothetical protein